MMISITMLILILVYVEAHGRFSNPSPRAYLGSGGPNAPTYTCTGPAFGNSATSMRCHDSSTPGTITTVTAGKDLPVSWIFEAAHPGDCSIWISYDTDTSSPANWVKLMDMPGCLATDGKTPQTTTTTVPIPANMPDCEHCVMRWEWYAVQQVSNVEFYVQCFDVKIVGGNNNCNQPAPTTLISDISYLGSCPFYNPYNGAFDTSRSRGPKAWVAPTCGGGSGSTNAPTNAPTNPVVAPTNPTSAPTSAPTLAPTSAPTSAPTRNGYTYPPTSSPITIPINFPRIARATFTKVQVGEVFFIQSVPGGPTRITVSLKNANNEVTSGNGLFITESCSLNAPVFDPSRSGVGSPDCLGCISARIAKCTSCYDGKIGSELDNGSTNVQEIIDNEVNLAVSQSILGKGLTIMKGEDTVGCAIIFSHDLVDSGALAQHRLDTIMFTMPLLMYFLL